LFLTGGAPTDKTFTLQLIVQELRRYYHSDLLSNSMKPKALLMAFTSKTTFNIAGCTIHSTLRIPINQSLSNMEKLSSKLLNKLTDDYEQIKLMVINEVFLILMRSRVGTPIEASFVPEATLPTERAVGWKNLPSRM